MKPTLLIGICLVSHALMARAAYQDVVLADQPVGYWRLGDAAGSMVAANTGTLGAAANGQAINTVTFGMPGAVSGNSDTAVNFDGAQARVDVPFNAGLNTTTFTIEVWAKVSDGAGSHRSPLTSRDDAPQRGFIFYANPEDAWEFWTGTGEQVGWDNVGGAIVNYDTWTHLIGVYDGAHKLFYVDGVLVGGNQSRYTPNGRHVLRIGGGATDQPNGNYYFYGDVDEVAVYDKVLSPEAVVAHYTAGSGAPPDASVAPAIVVQPASADRFKNESVTFTVLATGSLPLQYQWQKNGADIPGATGSSLTLASLQTTDGADYSVVVSNDAGSLPSDVATLTVADVSKPVITEQPRSRTVLPGASVTFSVAATGSTVFEYQWQFQSQPIANATNASLTVPNVQTAQLGTYQVTVKNAAGVTDSDSATLQFPAPATKSYADTVKQDSPVAYWRLGEKTGDVADDAMGANDGAYLNGVILGQPGAPVGDTDTAAGFEVANMTKVDVPWSDVLNTPTFTVECWARVTGGSGNYRSPLTSRSGSPAGGYIFYAEPGNTWQFWVGTGGEGAWFVLSGPPVQANAYAHLAGLYDGTSLSFYVNGVLAGQLDTAFQTNDSSPLRIGGGATEGDGNYFFEGDVDEVAFYNTALSEERILAHYVAGFPLTTPPTITDQPKSKFAVAGATATFTVGATGGQPLSYQWYFNGQPIAGATTNTLTLTGVSTANTGDYYAIVSNAGGEATSSTATLTLPATPTQSYVDLVKADGPVGYWRLGEAQGEVADDQIGANDGLYLNGVVLGVPGAVPADADTAARFTAASQQKVDVAWTDLLNPPQFTVEVWARLTGGSSHRSPLTSRADQPQRGYIFYAEPGSTWQFWSGKGDQSGWDTIPGPAARLNQWDYLAATYDGTTKRFYVNGVEVGSSTAPFGANDMNPLRFGGGATEGEGSFFFEGDIDEPAVYAKALTDEQIILHYLAGTAGGAPPVIGIARSNGQIVVTWDAGTLETATAVTGPWSPAAGATSPFTVPAGGPTASFYRARK
ncbi:MAG: LamG-like jellyroll fold domain-containing protein [Verrucomicrobiia bacterium]